MKADISKLARLTESEIEPAAGTLAQAFHDYPVFTYVFPDATERRNELPLLLQSFVHYAILHGEVYATSPNLEGVAVWLPPGYPGGFSTAPEVSKDALDRMAHYGREVHSVRRRQVPFSHWFLELIGVVPDLQGRGCASALLAPMLARIGHEHLPCYLDTEVESNVAIYNRYGFRVVDDSLVVGTGVRSWGMLWEAAD
jgi:ribosomal protein S18 acetylase RimI-like enzyme